MSRLLQDWAARQAELRPQARAVTGSRRSLSYASLDRLSSQVAHRLHEHGCRRGDRVALLLPEEPAAVAAVLGVLKAGAICVPLDPAAPDGRIRQTLHGADPRVVLVSSGTTVQDLAGYPAVSLATVNGAPGVWPSTSGRDPREPACELFTSDSSGIPRGITLSHRNLAHRAGWAAQYFRLGTGSRLAAPGPLSGAHPLFNLFTALAAGAELHLAPQALLRSPRRAVRFMEERKLDHWFSSPAVLELVARFDALSEGALPRLASLAWSGGSLSTQALRYWMARAPHVALTRIYGETETTVANAFQPVASSLVDDGEEMPLGRGCTHDEVVVLNDDLERVDAGAVGRIYVRGDAVGLGYWQDEFQTRAHFLEDPFQDDPQARLFRTEHMGRLDEDGVVYLVGREDQEIWSGETRIELNEVEQDLLQLPEVGSAAVFGVAGGDAEEPAIACAYVPSEEGERVSDGELRLRLSRVLPTSTVATLFRRVESLPLRSDGTVDRPALHRLFAEEDAWAAEPGGGEPVPEQGEEPAYEVGSSQAGEPRRRRRAERARM